ncbi:MAG: type II secretion system protein [Candidatus Omnitrophota bacterium]
MNLKTKRGFNLFELMVAVAVLSIGIVTIYESFLLIADASSGLPYYLRTQSLMNEMVWEQKSILTANGYVFPSTEGGSITLNKKPMEWTREIKLMDSVRGLYSVEILFSWKAGSKKMQNSRMTYIRR